MEIIKQKFPKVRLVLFVAVFLTILLLIIAVLAKPTPPILPIANPTIEKTPINRAPSTLATDSAFIKLEEDLRVLDQDLGNVDLSEPTLALPSLEMNVSF